MGLLTALARRRVVSALRAAVLAPVLLVPLGADIAPAMEREATPAAPVEISEAVAPTEPRVPEADGHPAVAAAEAHLGVPYKWGGTDPATGLDCSGFIQRVFADIGVEVPRVSADQARAGDTVGSLEDARPGDVLFWEGAPGESNHVGLYLGDSQMMHAPRTGDVVKVSPVRNAPPDEIRRLH